MSRVRSSSLLRRWSSARCSPSLAVENSETAVAARGVWTASGLSTAPWTTPRTSAASTSAATPLLCATYNGRQQHGDGAGATIMRATQGRARFSNSSMTMSRAGEAGAEASSSAGLQDGDGDGAGGEELDDEDAFDDPRIAILDAALDHVEAHGFSATALAAGAKDCGFHSVMAGMFPKGEADLVHHLMAKALREVKRLNEEHKTEAEGGDGEDSSPGSESEFPPSETERLRDGIKAALSCLAPYKAHWPHAMSIGFLPQNAGSTATAVAVLADELAFLSGDRSTDLAWYGKRGMIAGMYASTELFMLTDESEGLRDTWAFLDRLLTDYEILASSPENAADVATGVSTVATSLSSAAVSLAKPFLRQASKKVPGVETLAQTAPDIGALASQVLSFVASQVPHAGQAPYGGSASGSSQPASSSAGAGAASGAVVDDTAAQHQHGSESEGEGEGDSTPTFPGAPERDPWSGGTPGSGLGSGSGSGSGSAATGGKAEKFHLEEELAREERELFGQQDKNKNSK